jgi:uncharacterized membrane protein YbhN (UPF0104 family)
MKEVSKVRKIANLVIQLFIFTITYGFIYRQVFLKNSTQEILRSVERYLDQTGFITGLGIVVFMMAVNWSIEALKWKFLIAKIEPVGFIRSLGAVLTGISISSFTPNRVGEFFGRVFILRSASHIKGILITVLGSLSQLLITILAGSVALLIFLPRYFPLTLFGHGYLYYALMALVLALDLILTILYFNISFLSTIKDRIVKDRFLKIKRFFDVYTLYRKKELGIILLLSFLRYVVFSLQFYILLRLFSVQIGLSHALVLVSLIFLIMSVIPTVALTELGIRGSVSLYVFGLYFTMTEPSGAFMETGVLSASIFLWIINLAMPAVLGTIFLFRLQFFRKRDFTNVGSAREGEICKDNE